MVYPINDVRSQFPALSRTYHDQPVAYFDGPGGSQVISSSIKAISNYMERGGANLHGAFPSSWETEAIIVDAKKAVADFLVVDPKEVAFGANMTTLTLAISRALAKTWNPGDEIVVTEMDHRANVDPWLVIAEERGVKVRWIPINKQTLTLDTSNLNKIINDKTRLVAVGYASNAIGTIVDVETVSKRAKEVSALVAVDAVHAAPHIAIDRDQLGADILLCSAYKFFGPHIGIAAIKKKLLESLVPYKLVPAPDYIPDKFETGTQNHEGIAGIQPAIEFYASLGEGRTRREKIINGYHAIESHENRLATKIREALAKIDKVSLTHAGPSVAKTPTIAFRVEGYTPQQVCEYLAEKHAIFVACGHFYASTIGDVLGVNPDGGWIRAGLAPYNSDGEVDRFIYALQQL